MNIRAPLLSVVLLLLANTVWSAKSSHGSGMAENLVGDIYRPLHRQFAQSSAQWASEIADLCERRPASSAFTLQATFGHVLEDYAAIELFRLGPLLEDNLQNRLFYWPDKRGVAERQLRGLLNAEDASSLSAEELAGKSVALQGFTALERLLYTPGLQPLEVSPQCDVIIAIVQNLASMAGQLDAAWSLNSGFTGSLITPDSQSEHFRSEEEVLRSVFTQISVGLDVVLDGKLAPLLSNEIKTMQQTPMWKSQRTVAMLTGNLLGLRALLLDSGILADTRFEDELRLEFDYVDRILKKLKPIVYFVNPDGSLILESKVLFGTLAAVVEGIRYTVDVDVSEALGLSSGFNSEDGD